MVKKESLKEEIEAIHGKAEEMKAELKNMGLDDMIEDQERKRIAFAMGNAFWNAVK